MAGVLIPISSTTLGSSAASVTFSSIPQNYTDLVVRCSVRSDIGGGVPANYLYATLNGDSASNYSVTGVLGNGSSTQSYNIANFTKLYFERCVPAPATSSNAFGSVEMYLPNYTSTTTKPVSSFGASEANTASTGTYLNAAAQQYRGTSPISSITFTLFSDNFVAGSTFHLYGVK